MARDCPDRQRGTDWHNGGFGRGPRPIGAGDAVDREMEVSAHNDTFYVIDTNLVISNSCKNCLEVLQVKVATCLAVLKPDLMVAI